MKRARVLYQMVRADFLERTRRYSFLLTLGFAIYLAYATATDKVVLRLDDYRGVFNSAWLGSMMTLVSTTFLSLIGFYIVKNAILRDEQTRVGQILASTPMSRSFYTVAKTVSNFAVLASMLAVLAVAAVIMQPLHAEDSHLRLGTLLAPFVWVGLPAMAVTAAVAVLFETLPVLRSGAGNVIYFFVWGIGLALGANARIDDLVGFNVIGRNMQRVLRGIDPSYKEGISLTISTYGPAPKLFFWPGVDWTGPVILHRLLWAAAAVATALVASVFFHRFDPAREIWGWRRGPSLPAKTAVEEVPALLPAPPSAIARDASAAHLTPIALSAGQTRFVHLVWSELRLMLKGHRWWWYVAAAGLFIGCLASPLDAVRGGVLLAAWLWPVLIWSQMGARETRYATQRLIFSSERALYRQLPAIWVAGAVVALLTGGGVGIRLLLSANMPGFAAWLAAALFIPSLALALGVWSGTSKPFEALYVAWWYAGPANHLPGLDFMGTTAASSRTPFYALAAAGLLAISYFGRRVRLGYA
jgi:hypothetical protein